MAKNLTARVILADIQLPGGNVATHVFQSKDALMAFLYTTAVKGWEQYMGVDPRPLNRKGTIDRFFSTAGANAEYAVRPLTLITDAAAFRDAAQADARVRRERGASAPKTTGRSR